MVTVLSRLLVSEGRKHDASMLAVSGLLRDLEQYAFSHGGQPMCLYGDPACPLKVRLQGPLRFGVITNQAYNTAMSAVRSSVEWLFGDIINYFKFLDFKKNLGLVALVKCISFLLFSKTPSHVFMATKLRHFLTSIHQHWQSISLKL